MLKDTYRAAVEAKDLDARLKALELMLKHRVTVPVAPVKEGRSEMDGHLAKRNNGKP